MRNKPNVVRTSYIYHQDDVRRSLEYDKPINVLRRLIRRIWRELCSQ